jgi:very-short-patch-repair endonuclease
MQRLAKSERSFERARTLRREMSDEERILWMLLRDPRFAGFKFRRRRRSAIMSSTLSVTTQSW